MAFKKFLDLGKTMKVDVMIIGGDLSGKDLILIIDLKNGKFDVDGQVVGREGLENTTTKIRNSRKYAIVD